MLPEKAIGKVLEGTVVAVGPGARSKVIPLIIFQSQHIPTRATVSENHNKNSERSRNTAPVSRNLVRCSLLAALYG